jgi:hypothetical protein
MSYAILTQINKGKISFIKDLADNAFEERWTGNSADKFLRLLNDFYKKSNFHKFYQAHQPLYSLANERFGTMLEGIDFNWFEKYYGIKFNGDFHLILSLCNGGGNYGPSVKYKNGTENVYAIMGLWRLDSVGDPIYPYQMEETIIHEYNHSFCNPLIDEFYVQFQEKAESFFRPVENAMRKQAYSNALTMMREALVRTSVIMYYKEKDKNVSQMIMDEESMGFLITQTLLNGLSDYQQNRANYPTLKSYMPEMAKKINNADIKAIYEEFIANAVTILGTSIENKSTDIDSKITTLTVYFDKPMDQCCGGLSYGMKGKEYFPDFSGIDEKEPTWNEDFTAITYYGLQLKPNTDYSLSMPYSFFKGKNAKPVLKTYYLDFKTKAE